MHELTLKRPYTFTDLLELEKPFIINWCETASIDVFFAVKEIFERQIQYDAKRDEALLHIIVRNGNPKHYHLVLANDQLRSDLFEEGDCE